MAARLGSIEFINSLPVDLGLLEGAVPLGAEIIQGNPVFLNRRMAEGKLDVSPVSAFWYAQNFESLFLLPDLSISSKSGVQSVLLFSRFDFKDLKGKPIAVTGKGRTTPALLEVLSRVHYGFVPTLREVSENGGGIPPGCGALLLIGDEALIARERNVRSDVKVIDLAEEWRRQTGAPIVFAVWAVRRDYFNANVREVRRIHRALLQSREWGLAHLEEVLKRSREKTGLALRGLRSYFSSIAYDLDEELIKGMRLYFDLAEKCGLLAAKPAVEFVEP
ncbi:MAG: menaquinone biosynthesis protein [Candidatus Omnitrophica bacterium]|nr:menaquinone biosynthesis protein [Candidatus Omnitrophota bacterium]